MSDWSQGTVAANGLNVRYHRTGEGSGKPPILLLHGYTDNGLCWSPVAHRLSQGYDVIMTDARGHGQTEGEIGNMSVDLLAQDVAEIIQALDLQKPFLFGHSMGAMTALAAAASYPHLVRAALLEDPPFRQEDPFILKPEENQNLQADAKKGLAFQTLPLADRIAQGRAEHPNWSDDEIVPWAISKGEYNPDIVNHRVAFRSFSWRKAIVRTECALLLITADAEKGAIVTTEVAQEAAKLAPNCEVAYISNAAHCIHRDQFSETMQVVLDFLNQH